MTKQLCIKRIYDKILSKLPPNGATSVKLQNLSWYKTRIEGSILVFDTMQVLYWPVLGRIQFCTLVIRCKTCLDTKPVLYHDRFCSLTEISYLTPLWRHASLLNDGSCSFTHPAGSKCARNVVRYGKLCGHLITEDWFFAIKMMYIKSPIIINIYEVVFGGISLKFKHNHNESYRHWRQYGDWDALSIVTLATYWRFTHPALRGNHYSFAPKFHAVML